MRERDRVRKRERDRERESIRVRRIERGERQRLSDEGKKSYTKTLGQL